MTDDTERLSDKQIEQTSEADLSARLAPSAAMLPLLTALSETLDRWKTGDRLIPAAIDFDEVPVRSFGTELARFPLALEGWPLGVVEPIGARAAGERDILHRLLTELNLMSVEDLTTRFRDDLEGSRTAAAFKRMQEADNIDTLLRDETTLGWGGFAPKRCNPALEARMLRERMFTDRYLGVFNWTMLRGWDAARGAALIVEAQKGEMIDDAAAERYFLRVAGEMMVRFKSWHEFARSLIFARTYASLAVSETYALETLQSDAALLETLLEGPWAAFAWPRVKKPETGEVRHG